MVSVARQMFGCSTLDGVELEDGGGTGTASSHWEKRLLMNEFMTGVISNHPVITPLTLALMQVRPTLCSVSYSKRILGGTM